MHSSISCPRPLSLPRYRDILIQVKVCLEQEDCLEVFLALEVNAHLQTRGVQLLSRKESKHGLNVAEDCYRLTVICLSLMDLKLFL